MAKDGADLVVSGLAANAIATARFSEFPFGDRTTKHGWWRRRVGIAVAVGAQESETPSGRH